MASIEDLVARVALPGIPWDSIHPAGGADPAFSQEFLKQYLQPAYQAAQAVFNRYQWLPSAAEIRDQDQATIQAYLQAADALDRASGRTLAAADSGAPELSASDAVTMPLVTLRTTVFAGMNVAMDGLLMLLSPVYYQGLLDQVNARKLTPDAASERIRQHADTCYRVFTAITRADSAGLFVVVPKQGAAQAGLGQISLIAAAAIEGNPVGVAIVAIVSVLLIGLLACLVYYLHAQVEQNKQQMAIVKEACSAATASGNTTKSKLCTDLMNQANTTFWDKFLSATTSVLNRAMPWLIGAGLIVGGVYFAPLITRKVLQARKEARA